MPFPRVILLLCLALLAPAAARADCYWKGTLFTCDTVGTYNSVGRTLPLVMDSIRFNPASLPTGLTPAGVEATYSTDAQVDRNFQVSLIKGLPFLGFGVSNWSETSFFTPDVHRLVRESFPGSLPAYRNGDGQGFRAGGAIGVPLGEDFRFNVGASTGKGRIAGSDSFAYGATLEMPVLSLGLSHTSETVIPAISKARTTIASVGLHLAGVYLGYSYMRYSIGITGLPEMNFFSLRYTNELFALYAAYKRDSVGLSIRTSATGSLQGKISDGLVLAYTYGLYPNSHSLGLQIYF